MARTLALALLLACHRDGRDPTDDPTTTVLPPDPTLCADHPGEQLCDGLNAMTCSDEGVIASVEVCDPKATVCLAGACESCAPEVTIPGGASELIVEVDAAGPSIDRPWRLRPVVLPQPAIVEVTGPVVLLGEGGAPIADGATVDPGTLYVGAAAPGEGTVRFGPAEGACEASPRELPVTAIAPPPLAVRSLDGFPWVEAYDVFTSRDTVSVDLTAFVDRTDPQAVAYVVPHRDDWAAGDALDDAVAGPVPVSLGEVTDVWDDVPADVPPLQPYDLVVDFGDDGTLDAGDLLDGAEGPALYVGGDLTAPGPYPVTQDELSSGYWTTMVVYWPDPPTVVSGAMPLVVISHGNGHDYTWYDYLGRHFASYGFVVISHRNDTQPGPITASATTRQNTDAFLAALPQAFGGILDGHVDPHRIAWIGHSRGGEGVVIAYNDVVTGAERPANFTADDIVLVSSIAPTVFEDPMTRVSPHEVPYHLIAGSRDGDVTGGVDLDLVQYFRILQTATGPTAVTYVEGADHNDFNCCGVNDANFTSGPGPIIGRERAQQAAKSYFLALLEATFHGQAPMWEYFERAPERFRPEGVDLVLATQLERADGGADKIVIDDFQSNPDAAVSSSGGAVTSTLPGLAEGVMDDRNTQLTHDPSDPFNGMSQAHNDGAGAARGLVVQWGEGDDGLVEFEVPPAGRDVRGLEALSLRAAQSTRHPNTVALDGMLSFGIALVDGAGHVTEVDHRVYGGIPKPYARTGLGSGTGWVNEFQTIRVPIAAFTADPALDPSDVVAVRLLFGSAHGSPLGQVGLDDLELVAPGEMCC
ncbi:MAG: hypothetical protein R3F59_16420 [Myxococcota bacterium]